MRNKLTILALGATTLTACTAGQTVMGRIQSSNDESKALYEQVLQENISAGLDTKNKCKSPHYQNSRNAINELGRKVDKFYKVTQQFGRYSDVEISVAKDQLIPAVTYHIQGLFDMGDTAQKQGCTKIARTAYEQVVKNYPGHAYSGYRERAMMELQKL